jgi:predicted nucleotidyltransferase component of viral defense system
MDIEKLANKIIANLALLNIKGKIKEIKEYSHEINVRLLLNGPLYRGIKEAQCFIPLNISLREHLLLGPKKENIISLYREIPNFEVFPMQEKEILAEKIRAIFTRLKPRDIYDLWFLSTEKSIDFDLELINKKLGIYNITFNLDEFKNRVNKMRNLWNTDLKNLMISDLPNFDVVKKDIFQKLKELA